MKISDKGNIKKFLMTVATPIYLFTAYFAVTESFELLLEAFNDDFWRLLTTL